MNIKPLNQNLPHLEGLNERQKEAVLQTEGPVLVIAGAGAGKTKTITHRILHLIKNGVEPHSILAITFTNKSAKEMRERVMALLHSDKSLNRPISFSEKPFVSTFHSLGVHILKEQSKILGLPRHFSIFDKTDSKQAVKRALEKFGMDPKQYEPAKILSVISKEKGNMVSVADFRESSVFGKVVLPIWEEYERILAQEKALDFDDLLLRTANLLKTNEEVRKYYQKVWKYIHIDEYQDTNKAQYLIAKLLCGENRNICAVGDIDQNIYSWRGADLKNLLNFEKDYPETKIILLEENYRSTQNILNVANKIIAKNKFRHEKNLFTKNAEGEKIGLYSAINEQDEAYFVAMKALEIVRSGTKPSEIAVLYRANFQSRVLEEAFLSLSVPYQLLGTKFFERKEVKDVLSYIRAGLNPESLSDIKRIINVPARGIGKVTLLKILEGKKEDLPPPIRAKSEKFYELLKKIREASLKMKPSDLVRFVIKETGLEESLKHSTEEDAERLENIHELATLALRYDHLEPEKAIENLLADASLASDQDELEEKKEAVKLMTVHSAKGLEFDTVFVVGLEEDLFPHKRLSEGRAKDSDGEEERRLFYVAITRARKKLYLCYAGVRTIFGTTQVNVPSEFLGDVEDEYIDVEPAYPFDERPSGKFKTIYFD